PGLLILLSGPVAMIAYGLVRRTAPALPIVGAVSMLYAVSGVVAVVCLWRSHQFALPVKVSTLKPIAMDLLPAATFTLFSVFSVTIDRWIVSFELGPAAIGSYAAAMLIIQAALRVPRNIAYLIVPASSRVALGGPEKIVRFSEKTVYLFAWFATVATVALMVAPKIILRTLFGEGFVSVASVLMIMAPVVAASAVSVPFVSLLTGSRHNRLVTYLLGGTLPLRLLLLLVFTRWWSLTGAATATLIAEIVLAALCLRLARGLSIHFPLRSLQRPFVAAIIAYACAGFTLVVSRREVVAVVVAVIVLAV